MNNTDIALKPEQKAFLITERIKDNGKVAVNAVCEIGKDLRTMKVEELYKCIGYESFEDYAEQEFSLKRRQAYQYISVFENLGEAFVQSNAQLGITKLSLLTQMNPEDRAEIMEQNDLEGMTVNEVRELIDKTKQQGEQLAFFEQENTKLKDSADEAEKLRAEKAELHKRIEELESRPVEVAVAEPEIKEVVKEVIKEVPDQKAIDKKNKEIDKLKMQVQTLTKEKDKLESERVQAASEYEQRIEALKAAPKADDTDKASFKKLFSAAYSSFLALIEYTKQSTGDERELYIQKVDKLRDTISDAVDDMLD